MFSNTTKIPETKSPSIENAQITDGDMHIEFPYAGYTIDKNKSIEFDALLKKIKFQTEIHTTQKPQTGFFSVLYGPTDESSMKIIIPAAEIQDMTEEYQQLKKLIAKWDANLAENMNVLEQK